MPEIATAWVTLAASTRGMERDVRQALERVERGARLNPRVDSSRMGAEGARAGRQFASRFNSSTGSLGKTMLGTFGGFLSAQAFANLAAVGARAYVDQFQQILSTGLSFERTLNNFQGVTRATTSEMQAMQSTARALGSDTTLAGASASDAALAMTELAKAGFSIHEAMGAARGTLELATAGQIDAAQAAEIQANAMNAFGLGAESAARTTDLLANAAIASSADIPDLGLALQQVGGVAHGFGVSIDDTVAALAMFANAGIKGSDAGTLLKTTMQSITDQGNPAQGAIEAMNLSLYDFDSQQFVGFRELFRQLDEAKKRMSPQEFQAQANILFGSDAMRSAMLGNQQAFDEMLENLGRVGAGAELAEAQMQGLPGAVEAFSNTMEGIRLGAFDAIGPVATDSLNQLVQWMGDHQPEIIEFFTTLAQVTLQTAGAFGKFTEGALNAFATFLDATYSKFGAGIEAIGQGALTIGGILRELPGMGDFGNALTDVGARATVTGQVMQRASDDLRGMADGAGAMADGLFGAADSINEAGDAAAASAAQTRLYKDSFAQLSAAVTSVPGSKDIVLRENSPEIIEKLKQLGFAVQNLPDGRQVIRLEWRDPAGNLIDPSQLRTPGFIPAVPGEIQAPRGGGRAAGGAILGAGGPKDDRIPAWLSNGEHVLTAADVAALGGQGGVYAFRDALHRATGGAMKLAQVIPDLRRKRKPGRTPGTIGLPDWTTPGQGWGAPPPDWWLKPVDPDSILFPEWQEPGSPWKGRHPHDQRIKKFAGGGSVGSKSGLQPNASQLWDILVSAFPQIETIGGVRNDPLPDHPSGVGLDVMIPNWDTPEGRALGDQINSFIRTNADALGIDSTIWRDTWADMLGNTSTVGGHQNHIHVKAKKGPATGAALSSFSALDATSGAYGYDTPDPQKIADAEENLRAQRADVAIQEQQLAELEADATASQRMAAEEQLRKAKADEAKAVRELEEAKRGDPLKETDLKTGSGKGDPGADLGQNLGQSLISGLLQGLGLDGSVFSNPMEWPNVKSGIAALNWGGGMLKSMMGAEGEGSTTTAGGGGLSLPGIGDFLKPISPGPTAPLGSPASGVGHGPAPGPQFVINGNVGMDPRALTQRFDAGFNQAYRRNLSSVRPK